MFDIIVKAAHHETLTPGQRAYLKALQNFIIGVVATVLVALLSEVVKGRAIDVALLSSAGVSALYIVLNAFIKYLSAHNEEAAAKFVQAGEDLAKVKIPVKPFPLVGVADTPPTTTATIPNTGTIEAK